MYPLSLFASSGRHLAQNFINPIQLKSYWTFAVWGGNGGISKCIYNWSKKGFFQSLVENKYSQKKILF